MNLVERDEPEEAPDDWQVVEMKSSAFRNPLQAMIQQGPVDRFQVLVADESPSGLEVRHNRSMVDSRTAPLDVKPKAATSMAQKASLEIWLGWS